MAWKTIGHVSGTTEDVVSANPLAEVKRFLFKDAGACVEVEYNGETRRVYDDGVVTEDNFSYPKPLKSLEDYADALCWMAMVGERSDYMEQVRGTTKKQRDRMIRRRIESENRKSLALEAA